MSPHSLHLNCAVSTSSSTDISGVAYLFFNRLFVGLFSTVPSDIFEVWSFWLVLSMESEAEGGASLSRERGSEDEYLFKT